MNISSRTPEGSPNRCRVCGAAVRIEPSRPPGDAPCPHCGALLWFNGQPSGTKPFVAVAGWRLFLVCAMWMLMQVTALTAAAIGFYIWPMEGAIVAVLVVLLFGRPLLKLGRYLDRLVVSRSTRS